MATTMSITTKVYVVFYSVHGHVETMAREVQRGADSVDGVEATLWRVPETLPKRVLEKMKAPPNANDVPEITPEQLLEADGFLFGSPSRFGMMASQFLAFFDATRDIFASQKLAGKPAGIFWSTGFHGGGQENTAFTAITQLAHHGMLYVPLGYTFGEGMYEMNEVKGGSSYGAGTYAGDGSRQPTELELNQAFYQGDLPVILEDTVWGYMHRDWCPCWGNMRRSHNSAKLSNIYTLPRLQEYSQPIYLSMSQ